MRNRVLCVIADGYSASSRSNVDAIESRFLSAAQGLETTVGVFHSPWFMFPRFRIKRFLGKHTPGEFRNIFIGGKSFGAYLLCNLIEEGLFTQYENIACVFVDPHSPANTAGIDRPINMLVHGPVVDAVSIYQQDHWPHGARVHGARNVKVSGVDHFSIINHTAVFDAASEAFGKFNT